MDSKIEILLNKTNIDITIKLIIFDTYNNDIEICIGNSINFIKIKLIIIIKKYSII